jgi:hypothetical protein
VSDEDRLKTQTFRFTNGMTDDDGFNFGTGGESDEESIHEDIICISQGSNNKRKQLMEKAKPPLNPAYKKPSMGS